VNKLTIPVSPLTLPKPASSSLSYPAVLTKGDNVETWLTDSGPQIGVAAWGLRPGCLWTHASCSLQHSAV
jgi:hypothetical protein